MELISLEVGVGGAYDAMREEMFLAVGDGCSEIWRTISEMDDAET